MSNQFNRNTNQSFHINLIVRKLIIIIAHNPYKDDTPSSTEMCEHRAFGRGKVEFRLFLEISCDLTLKNPGNQRKIEKLILLKVKDIWYPIFPRLTSTCLSNFPLTNLISLKKSFIKRKLEEIEMEKSRQWNKRIEHKSHGRKAEEILVKFLSLFKLTTIMVNKLTNVTEEMTWRKVYEEEFLWDSFPLDLSYFVLRVSPLK